MNSKVLIHTLLISTLLSSYINSSIIQYFLFLIYFFFNFFKKKFFISEIILFFLLFLIFFINIILFNADFFKFFISFKFFYGFVFIFYFAKWNREIIKIYFTKNFFHLICYLIILETLLINLLPFEISKLIFLSKTENFDIFYSFYIRPPGFGGNAPMTSILLLILFYTVVKIEKIIKFKTFILLSFLISILHSGTGFLLYFLVIFYLFFLKSHKVKFEREKIILILLILIIFIFIFINLYLSSSSIINETSKLSYNYYIKLIVDQKIEMLKLLSLQNYVFGDLNIFKNEVTSSDYGIYWFFLQYGLIGIITFIYALKIFFKDNDYFAYLITALSIIHYPAIFQLSGGIILSLLLLSQSHETKNKYNYN